MRGKASEMGDAEARGRQAREMVDVRRGGEDQRQAREIDN